MSALDDIVFGGEERGYVSAGTETEERAWCRKLDAARAELAQLRVQLQTTRALLVIADDGKKIALEQRDKWLERARGEALEEALTILRTHRDHWKHLENKPRGTLERMPWTAASCAVGLIEDLQGGVVFGAARQAKDSPTPPAP